MRNCLGALLGFTAAVACAVALVMITADAGAITRSRQGRGVMVGVAASDAGVLDADGGFVDADGGFVDADAGVDSGPTPVPAVAGQSQSWGSPGSNFGGPAFTAVQRCTDDASVCAFWYDPVSDSAEAAAEDPTDNASTYVVPSAQALARILGGDTIVAVANEAWPGIATNLHDVADDAVGSTSGLLDGLDALAAMVAGLGHYCLDVRIYNDNGGGFQLQEAGQPFSTWSAAIETQRSDIATHIAAAIAGTNPGYCADWVSADMAVTFNFGNLHQASGTGWTQHPYTDGFAGYVDSTHFGCGEFYWVTLGVDNVHPTEVGSGQLAASYAVCWDRVLAGRTITALIPTAVTPVDLSTVDVTFDVPCRPESSCANDPPIEYDATAVALQESNDVATGGMHFWRSGTLQTPPAVSSITPQSCAPGSSCVVRFAFASPLPDYTEVSLCDTADDPGAPASFAGAGGCNLRSEITTGWNPPETPVSDWAVSGGNFTVSQIDAGVADIGPDGGDAAAPDAEPPDGGDAGVGTDAATFASTYSIEFNASGGNASRTVTSGALDDLDSQTWLAWVNNPSQFEPAISRWGGGGASTEQWWVGVVTGAQLHYAIGFEQAGDGADCLTGSPGTWHQIGFVYTSGGSPDLQCFYNGVDDTDVINGTLGSSLNDEDQDLTIGGSGQQADVDTVLYFNCALTASEVLDVFCATHGVGGLGDPGGACATAGIDETDFGAVVLGHPCFGEWWEFEQVPTAYNGNDLTENGTPTYTTAQP